MTVNLSNQLIGLGLLTGTNSVATFAASALPVESRAARQAKALFTTPATTAPWKQPATTAPVATQLSTIKGLKTIIDKAATGTGALPSDVQTAFTSYKALDRLRVLAQSAANTGTSSTERAALDKIFAQGLDDLQAFLGSAPTDALKLAFGQPARRAESVAVLAPATLAATRIAGKGVAESRSAPLAGLTGTEQFRITLSKTGANDSVTVDLAGTPQPPSLDSIAAAINAAIAAVPMRDGSGEIVLDLQGTPQPRWTARFVADKSSGKWGLGIERGGNETVAIDQIGAGDTLIAVTGATPAGAATTSRIMRFDDPAGAIAQRTAGGIAAIDSDATERAKLVAKDGMAPNIAATTAAKAIATDAQGFSYVVGTTSGDIGANLSDGGDDLFLTKFDSEGKPVWQRSLGAGGTAQGAAVSVAANGDIVVAGTVKGAFNTATSDGDMLVARFTAAGDEQFATLIRASGSDVASAVAVGADGAIYVGGKSASGGGDAFIARLDATGHIQERRSIDSGGNDGVTALALAGDGTLLALTREGSDTKLRRIDGAQLSSDLGSLSLGNVDARAIAVAGDGRIAVAGATLVAVPGTQVNTPGGERDGFVARIDAALSSASVTYLATAGDDQIDSIAFMGGALYAGGRTTGALGAPRTGAVDGFITRIDAASGAIASTRQFGQPTLRAEPVRIAAIAGGNTVLGALGFNRGTVTPVDSAKLVAQTALRPGDEFSLRIAGGPVRKIIIGADDTLTTLADRIRVITGSKATVGTPASGTGNILRIEPKPGVSIEFVAGADGKDALAKLGLPAARITVPAVLADNAPKVRPGGSFGLGLSDALGIGTAATAALALDRINQAISVSQTGYRSLYWDDTKAALANGYASNGAGASTSREKAQLAQYQAALTRLSTPSTSIGF